MKTFVFVLILFVLLLGGISFNYIYTHRISQELFLLADKLPQVDSEKCVDSVDILQSKWDSQKNILKLSLRLKDVEKIDDHLSLLKLYAKDNRSLDFETTRALLKNCFFEITRFESLNPFTP